MLNALVEDSCLDCCEASFVYLMRFVFPKYYKATVFHIEKQFPAGDCLMSQTRHKAAWHYGLEDIIRRLICGSGGGENSDSHG